MKRWHLAALFALGLSVPAFAQPPPTPQGTSVSQGNVVISVTNAGETSALPVTPSLASGALTYYNSGSKDAFCAPVLTSGTLATTAALKIPANGGYLTNWNTNYYAYVSCVTGGSDTTSVTVYQSNGPLQFGMLGGSGGGGGPGVSSYNTRTGAVTSQASDISSAGGLLATNNLSDVGTPATALSNIGGIGPATTNTLTNKTISGASNTLSNIGNGSLTNSSLTIGSTGCSLGATCATIAGLTLTAPALGAATATSINKVTLTQPATGSTLTLADGKTLTANNSLTLSGTDSSTLNIGTGGTLGSNAFTSTAFAPLASPALTGTPTAPTAAVNTNTTQLATTAFVIGQGYGTGNCSVTGSAGVVSNNGSSACATDTSAVLTAGALALGASGAAGSVALGNATSGTVTIQPVTGALGSVTASLPANTGTLSETNLAESFTAVKTFTNSDLKLLGSSTGATTFTSANSGASNFTLTFPSVTSTLACLACTETFSVSQTFADGTLAAAAGFTFGAGINLGGFSATGGGNIIASNNNGYELSGGTCVTASTTVCLSPDKNTLTAGVGANGVSGDVSLVGGAGVVNLYVTGAANTSAFLPSITTDSTHTDAAVCEDTTTHGLYFGSGTAGICLGTSSARYKHDIHGLDAGLPEVMALDPVQFRYNKGYIDSGVKEQFGFLAEAVVRVMPSLVGLDKQNRPNSVDILGIVPVLVRAMKTQQDEIDGLFFVVFALAGWNVWLTTRRRR